MFLHPSQRGDLVEQAQVGQAVAQVEEALDTNPVIDGHAHHKALPASLRDTIERSEPELGLALIERQNDNDRTYRVAYGELTAPIIKAIQE
jgi:hypothetical protein